MIDITPEQIEAVKHAVAVDVPVWNSPNHGGRVVYLFVKGIKCEWVMAASNNVGPTEKPWLPEELQGLTIPPGQVDPGAYVIHGCQEQAGKIIFEFWPEGDLT